MGYYTEFYGKLEFTRRLTPAELQWVDRVMHEPREVGSKAYRDYWDAFERSGREWDNDGDNERARQEADRALEESGYVRIADQGYEGDVYISPRRDGLMYGSEKSYDLVSGVNFIIANARRRIPDFGLKGSLFASTEFEPYHWLLKIGEDGWAHQAPLGGKRLWSYDKRAALEGLYLRVRCEVSTPIYAAARRHRAARREPDAPDTRNQFTKAMDALCDRALRFSAERYDQMWAKRLGTPGLHRR